MNNGVSYLTRTEAAEILRVHPSTIRHWEKQKKLDRFNDRHGWALYSVEEVLRLKKRRKAWGEERKIRRTRKPVMPGTFLTACPPKGGTGHG